ncbi:prepilin peptidase [Corynebacterium lubricantis]|uniref:prepilin peptidase n=1 Tax=Corynebacterium lubricantis TaxID=541095 RepID=UPI000371C8AB|nr:A24 family peptidase [Corynebacterium lubricantis]
MWGLGGALLWSVALIFSDLRERRLPNVLTLPAGAIALVWALFFSPGSLIGVLWPALYLVVALLRGGVGGGDIKLALPLGIAVASTAGFVGVWVAIVLASVTTVIVAKIAADSSAPHGPGMLLGAWAVWAAGIAGLGFMHYTY